MYSSTKLFSRRNTTQIYTHHDLTIPSNTHVKNIDILQYIHFNIWKSWLGSERASKPIEYLATSSLEDRGRQNTDYLLSSLCLHSTRRQVKEESLCEEWNAEDEGIFAVCRWRWRRNFHDVSARALKNHFTHTSHSSFALWIPTYVSVYLYYLIPFPAFCTEWIAVLSLQTLPTPTPPSSSPFLHSSSQLVLEYPVWCSWKTLVFLSSVSYSLPHAVVL